MAIQFVERSRGVLLAAAAVLLISGCALGVGRGTPRPNVDVAQHQETLGLELAPAVQDVFSVKRDSVTVVNVEQWHSTLEDGFRAAFSPAFSLGTGATDLKVQVLEAELTFVPSGVGEGGVNAAEAQIRYKARLVDAQGQVLKRSTGTVVSKRILIRMHEATEIATSAVESLYERVAADFFGDAPVTAVSVAP